jgi:hypothetical protein
VVCGVAKEEVRAAFFACRCFWSALSNFCDFDFAVWFKAKKVEEGTHVPYWSDTVRELAWDNIVHVTCVIFLDLRENDCSVRERVVTIFFERDFSRLA